jgi:sugar/nucleoside kinase (ribokinase family)
MFDMVVLGAMFLDQEFRFMGSVEKNGRGVVELAFQEEERGKDLFLSPGGSAANTAIQAARLGLKAKALGKVGRDPYGDLILEGLRRQGVDVTDVRLSDRERTGTTLILSGRRNHELDLAMVTFNGANETLESGELGRVPEGIVCSQGTVFFIGDFFSLPRLQPDLADLLARARRMGMVTVIDHGRLTRSRVAERVLKNLEAAMQYVDVYLPSEREVREFSGREDLTEALDVLMEKFGIGLIVTKRGARGCRVRTAREDHEIPAFPVREGGVSALGAGSAFNAAFLWQWRKDPGDLVRAASTANAAGRIKIVSGQAPTEKRLRGFLDKEAQRRGLG